MSSARPSKLWMHAELLSEEYINGARLFIKFAQDSLGKEGDWYCCPCVTCQNGEKSTAESIYEHIICKGIDKSYTVWVHHGEPFPQKSVKIRAHRTSSLIDHGVVSPRVEDMVNDAFGRTSPNDLNACLNEVQNENNAQYLNDEDVSNIAHDEAHNNIEDEVKYRKLMEDALQPLYPSCNDKDSKLSSTVELLSMKSRHRWSDRSFTELLGWLKHKLPVENTIPEKTASAKAMIKSLRLKCEVIDVCRKECILYWREYENDVSCPKCKESRWKPIDESKPNAKRKPWKKLRYFPLTERLQKMYSIPWIAENMKWHANSVENQSHMRHPVDSSCWKSVNYRWKEFSAEARNVRLGLATDGFNPFGHNSNSHSCWPVMMVPYNLPPSLCMRKEFVMLTLLIPGPTGPGNNIDVYLQPLVEELITLWSKGSETYDSHAKTTFNMRAILLWTIHDFPAYGHVSGCRTAGKFACPVCGEGVHSVWLTFGKKFAYMGCRRFLTDANHLFRTQKSQFNGKEEHGKPPRRLRGSEVLSKMNKIQTVFGNNISNKRKRSPTEPITPWSKKSIFFNLEYWEVNFVLLYHTYVYKL